MPSYVDEYTPLLVRASASPYGIAVETSDPELLRQRIYKICRESNGAYSFHLFIPAAPGELWIVRKDAPNAAAQEP